MAKSTKMSPKKLRLIGSPEIKNDVKNKKAKETRAFNKEKLEKEDAQRNATVRVAKRPEKKVK
jgi:hypothetical protein